MLLSTALTVGKSIKIPNSRRAVQFLAAYSHDYQQSPSSLRPVRYLNSCRRLASTNTSTHVNARQSTDGEDKNNERRNEHEKISVTFSRPDGTKVTVKTSQDKTLYDAVIDNDVDIDGFGACEGTLCCTTCHLIFKPADYEKLAKPSDEELDMLDLAYGLTDTSRLGCQVHLKRDLHPLEVEVPAGINDVREA